MDFKSSTTFSSVTIDGKTISKAISNASDKVNEGLDAVHKAMGVASESMTDAFKEFDKVWETAEKAKVSEVEVYGASKEDVLNNVNNTHALFGYKLESLGLDKARDCWVAKLKAPTATL